jgi:hypothetical protein
VVVGILLRARETQERLVPQKSEVRVEFRVIPREGIHFGSQGLRPTGEISRLGRRGALPARREEGEYRVCILPTNNAVGRDASSFQSHTNF